MYFESYASGSSVSNAGANDSLPPLKATLPVPVSSEYVNVMNGKCMLRFFVIYFESYGTATNNAGMNNGVPPPSAFMANTTSENVQISYSFEENDLTPQGNNVLHAAAAPATYPPNGGFIRNQSPPQAFYAPPPGRSPRHNQPPPLSIFDQDNTSNTSNNFVKIKIRCKNV